MTDTDAPEWPDPADKAHAVEQAKRLRNQAEGGLRSRFAAVADLVQALF
jgi:antitoxin ParD1/3/4